MGGNRKRLPRKAELEFVVSSVDIKPGVRVYLSNQERISRLEYYRKYVLVDGKKPVIRDVDAAFLDSNYRLAKSRYGDVLRKLAD